MSVQGYDSAYEVNLPEFEGPLDLLLHLVKRHELSILDIPISFVTDKYLEYLELMRSVNIDVASEYLLMAATLAHLKSRELLPRQELEEEELEEEEGEDPREELIRRLLEYQRYREVAQRLGDQPTLGRQTALRGAPQDKVDPSELPLQEVGTFALLSALAGVMKRARVKLSYDVVVDRISISDRINQLVDHLAKFPTARFSECFSVEACASPQQLRHHVVVTFLALLEMARLQMVHILQHEADGEIYLTQTDALQTVDEVEGESA